MKRKWNQVGHIARSREDSWTDKSLEWYPSEREGKRKASMQMAHGNEESLPCNLAESSGEQNRMQENERCVLPHISE